MQAVTMDYQLTIPAILRRAEAHFADKRIVSRQPDHGLHRYTYRDCLARARRLGAALQHLGVKPGDRVATLCWNHHQHVEAYFAIPWIGAVLHTLNLRLHPDDLAYIANHAGDRIVIVDASLLPLLAGFRDRAPIERVIVVGSGGALPPNAINYEELIASTEPAELDPPELRENAAAAMCYTSGTTGRPKGVVYSHRAIALHSMASAMADTFGLREADTVLPVVPMFHANAWGLPFSAALVGANLVLPGPYLDAPSLLELLGGERVTFTAGVPTVWNALLDQLDRTPGAHDLSALETLLVGGAAVPEAMIRGFAERHGLRVLHAWGMTELAPLGTVAMVPARDRSLPTEFAFARRGRQGTPAPFIEIRARGDDGLAPWDDSAVGELEVRGPWVAAGYHDCAEPNEAFTSDGWFRTGDVVSIDGFGSMQIRDRAKDLIKSGGEWISSVALENALMAHGAVAEAAVVGVPHPRWQERPLAVVVCRTDHRATAEELQDHLAQTFPKWWIPDAMVFADAIPKTSTGKFLKTALRDQHRAHYAESRGG